MGRLSGFLGGTILTTSIAYLTHRHLLAQTHLHSTSLRRSRQTFDSILLPTPPRAPRRDEIERPSFAETLKDEWNSQVEGLVRSVQNWDVARARERGEGFLRGVVERLRG